MIKFFSTSKSDVDGDLQSIISPLQAIAAKLTALVKSNLDKADEKETEIERLEDEIDDLLAESTYAGNILEKINSLISVEKDDTTK